MLLCGKHIVINGTLDCSIFCVKTKLLITQTDTIFVLSSIEGEGERERGGGGKDTFT